MSRTVEPARIRVTLSNSFHNRKVTIIAPAHWDGDVDSLSARVQRRIRDTLCGSPTCTCGVVRP